MVFYTYASPFEGGIDFARRDIESPAQMAQWLLEMEKPEALDLDCLGAALGMEEGAEMTFASFVSALGSRSIEDQIDFAKRHLGTNRYDRDSFLILADPEGAIENALDKLNKIWPYG